MNEIAISVIVPIYNMEKLMRKCLDSILAQTFHNYECLMIDDGSTDGSPVICDEYAAKDARFKAYHKPNGGLSDARNFGLAHAIGEYTIFFDPDDWVDNECLKEMYAKAVETNADMVMCDIYYNDLYRQKYGKQEPSSLWHVDVLRDLITGKVAGFTVTKLIRRSLYQRYHIEYPKGLYGREDQYTMCELLMNNIKVAYLPKAYYHYMHYFNASQSRRYDDGTYEMDKKILEMFENLFKNHPLKEQVYVHLISFLVGHAFLGGKQFFSNEDFVEEFKQYEIVLKKVPRSRITNMAYWLSFRGHYQLAITVYLWLFSLKQALKRL